MKKQSHLTRAVMWFNSLEAKGSKGAIHIREWNMWQELFEAAEHGEI